MALTGLHTNWLTGSYAGDREYILRAAENTPLFNGENVAQNLGPHFDTSTSIAIGYGLDLLVNGDDTINSYLTAAGLDPLTAQDMTVLAQARTYRNTQLANKQPVSSLTMQNFANQLSLDLLTDGNARALLNVVADDKQNQLIQDLSAGGMSPQDLVDFIGTREFLALLSLTFNGIPPVVREKQTGQYLRNTKMLNAMLEGNRAEAWYEIRYNSNGNDLTGLAKRRFFEADTFGLYSAGASDSNSIADAEAKGVFRMFTHHRTLINDYENRFGQNGSRGDQVFFANRDYQLATVGNQVDYWTQESQIARAYLTTTYANSVGVPTIDGEVLVGQDVATGVGDTLLGSLTVKNDLLFGEKGNDWLFGFQGEDVLYGGEGNDRLTGGTGDDYLAGGPGNDTYYWNTGDGNDRIEDADGRDLIVADQRILVGGVRHTGDPLGTFRSLDGTYTYVIAGTDLEVHIGTAILTVNENFASGQFGIRLIDATEADYDNTLPTNTFTGTPDNDTIATGGGPGTFNAVVNAGAGDDFVLASANDDQLFGEAGADTLFGNSGDDRLYGGTENDALAGDNDLVANHGHDLLDGGAGADNLVGGWGDDVLFGGDGNDVLYGDTTGRAKEETDSADDFLDGGAGDDELHGLVGNDVLYGGADNDFLSGEEGDDVLDGGTGNDLLLAFTGQDTLAGGAGLDTLYGDRDDDILDGGTEADTLYGGDGTDVLYGGGGADQLFGDVLNNPSKASLAGAADFLLGGAGNDRLEGGIGDDTLFGEADHDVLLGQEGADSLFGDQGADELLGEPHQISELSLVLCGR